MRLRPLLVVALAACAPSPDAGPTGAAEVLVAASDYSSSMICGMPGRCRRGVDLGKDPQLALSNGRAFFIARDVDLVFELDPETGAPIARSSVHVDETKIGNPHDVAAAPDGSLFVALYNVPRIAVVKNGAVIAQIDLSPYDPEDGNPEAESVRIVDVAGAPKAFVTLERLEFDLSLGRYLSRKPSTMLRIDVASRTVEAAVELAGRNPFNTMNEAEGALFLAEPGDFDTAKEPRAGIERFDIATSTSRMVVREAELEGSVAEVAVAGGCGAAIVAGPEATVNPTSLVTFDPAEGRPSGPVLGPTPGYDLQGLAWRGNTLYVGDRREQRGRYVVHVLEREGASCALRDTGRVIELEQRPVALRPAR